MSTVTRLVAYVAGCAALFALALGVGRVVGPVGSDPAAAAEHDDMGAMPGMGSSGHDVGGLAASADGWTLALDAAEAAPGPQRIAFTITGADGAPLTAYDEQHERDLHLVVVRRDLTGFQHVHPTLDADTGEWSVDGVELTPGAWRVVADFVPAGGEKTVLGTDLLVPGDFAPEPLGADRRTASVDGYDVTLAGDVGDHVETVLTATVSRGGVPVSDLEPYLGAHGHLVALRDGDLGYLHVHPEDDGGAGPEVAFRTSFPSPGRYRLFLDFQHAGTVHTASFTVSVDDH
ncbi:hypothetical protein G5V58_19695 [Nocardioides anomalus]|uniref:Heavy-metal-associated domain-containing protein n=1 Tax=Nocardioides anomalus TaxID=2712223 RepID=A0A6G6WHR9_9ACTN|nr:hypothetical protein [Nocardioides anomalus]QIG44707.1 hypothetical protein G5V58_19695 [Nocardioides anomalus]